VASSAPSDEEGQPLHPKRVEHPDAKCPNHPRKEYRLMVRKAWDHGCWCEKRRKYIYCYPPDGKSRVVKVPMTPSSSWTLRSVKGRFAKAGVPM
jgi:hypothetical protein